MTRDPSDGSVKEVTCIPCESGHKPHSDGIHRANGHETECVADRFLSGLPLENGSVRHQPKPLEAKPYEPEKPSSVTASGLPLESKKPEQQAKLEKSREWLKYYHGTGE